MSKILVLGTLLLSVNVLMASQCGPSGPTLCSRSEDTLYAPVVSTPFYPNGDGPLVLFDQAHHGRNCIEDGKSYAAFRRILEQHGYEVVANSVPFDEADLSHVGILYIVSPVTALTEAETAAVCAFANTGGGVVVHADHHPFEVNVEGVANCAGVSFGAASVFPIGGQAAGENPYLFESFPAHEITNGITSVKTFVGVTLGGNMSAPLLVFGPSEFAQENGGGSAEGEVQGSAHYVGNGRMVLFGEALMFASWPRAGMNYAPENQVLLENVIRWVDPYQP